MAYSRSVAPTTKYAPRPLPRLSSGRAGVVLRGRVCWTRGVCIVVVVVGIVIVCETSPLVAIAEALGTALALACETTSLAWVLQLLQADIVVGVRFVAGRCCKCVLAVDACRRGRGLVMHGYAMLGG